MFGLCSQLSCMMKSPLKWQGRRMIVRRCKIDVLAAITYRKRCCDQQVAEAGPRSRLPPVSLCCAGICTQSVSSTLKSLKSSEGLYSKMTNQSTMKPVSYLPIVHLFYLKKFETIFSNGASITQIRFISRAMPNG